MDNTDTKKRFDHHRNAFGFLRLLFASLVIVSHTPELVDGDRHREILSNIFSTISFGELAVDGFFIVSGFLISASFLQSKTVWFYFLKRIARIYPAYVVASIICVTAVSTLGGAVPGDTNGRVFHGILNALMLRKPQDYGAFPGSHYREVDGAMWTIAFEWRCYAWLALLGLAGLLERSSVLA